MHTSPVMAQKFAVATQATTVGVNPMLTWAVLYLRSTYL